MVVTRGVAPAESAGYGGVTTVQDADGTTYSFPGPGTVGIGGSVLASSVEDRNGNVIQYVDNGGGNFTMTDTAGRRVISSSGFGGTGSTTLTVSGLANPYTLNWGTNTTWNYNIYLNKVYTPSNATCEGGVNSQASGGFAVLHTLTLPNNQSYTFKYDTTYGLLNEIDYPTGAIVKYTWNINLNQNQQSEMVIGPAAAMSGSSIYHCYYRYSTPMIKTRQVFYNGGTTASEEQDFTYTTNWTDNNNDYTATQWTSKKTIVTTYDLVRSPGRNLSFQTTYNYSTLGIPAPPDAPGALSTQVPVESQVVYKDWDGPLLRTVTKNLVQPVLDEESADHTLPSGPTSLVTYTYGNLGVVTNKSEFDYGQTPPATPPRDRPSRTISLFRSTL